MTNVMIKLDSDTIQKLAIFESITRTNLKDCIEDEDEIYFIVNSKDLGKAIGKSAINIKALEKKFRKKIILIGFEQDPKDFAINLLKPMNVKSMSIENEALIITIFASSKNFPSKKVKKAKMLLTKYFNNIKNVIIKV